METAGDAGLDTSSEYPSVAEVVGRAFPSARSDTRLALVTKADVREFRARQTIVPQGDDSQIGLVLDGHVGLRRATLDGRELIPRIASRGKLAPLLTLARRPSAAEALALSPSRVAMWSSGDVQALAAVDAGLAVDLLKHVILAFEEVGERMEGLLYQDAQRRVARVLEQHGAILFGEDAALPRTYLPALVGTSREMTGRVLRKLESNGVVARIGRDRLQLLDGARLSRMAAPPSTGRAVGHRTRVLTEPRRAMPD